MRPPKAAQNFLCRVAAEAQHLRRRLSQSEVKWHCRFEEFRTDALVHDFDMTDLNAGDVVQFLNRGGVLDLLVAAKGG